MPVMDITKLPLPDTMERPTAVQCERVTVRFTNQAHMHDLLAYAQKYNVTDKLGAALVQVLSLASGYAVGRKEDIVLEIGPDWGSSAQKEPSVTWAIMTADWKTEPSRCLYAGGMILWPRDKRWDIHT